MGQRFEHLDLTGRKVCVDAANGGGAVLAPRMLRAFGAEVVEVGCEPDGFNINEGCGALHPGALGAVVRDAGAHMGICLDGDGDRGIFVDERGEVVRRQRALAVDDVETFHGDDRGAARVPALAIARETVEDDAF